MGYAVFRRNRNTTIISERRIPLLSIEGFQSAFKYIQLFKEGLVCTVSLSAFTVLFGFILALALALMRMADFRPFRFLDNTQGGEGRTGFVGALSRFRPLNFIASVYVEVFRATPLMVQLFIVYYILLAGLDLPSFKLFGLIRFERFVPGVIALSLTSRLPSVLLQTVLSFAAGQVENPLSHIFLLKIILKSSELMPAMQ